MEMKYYGGTTNLQKHSRKHHADICHLQKGPIWNLLVMLNKKFINAVTLGSILNARLNIFNNAPGYSLYELQNEFSKNLFPVQAKLVLYLKYP